MDPRTGYYLLLKDVENPEFSSSPSWWGMLSSYVYTSEDVPPPETLALRGELFEAQQSDNQPEDTARIALRGVKQRFQHIECDRDDLKRLTFEETQLLLAVNSYKERCRIVQEECLFVGCSLEEGAKVFVWIKDIRKEVSGIVRYKGPVSLYDGTMFGVEILDQQYRRQGTCDGRVQCKRYFTCSPGSGLFVSLDKLCCETTSLPEKEAIKDEKDKLLPEKAENLDVEDSNKNGTCGMESKEKNLCNKLKTSEETQDNGISDNRKDADEDSKDKLNENNVDENSKEEVDKVEPGVDDAELKCVVDDLEQQLMKMKTELQEKEKKWKMESMEWEMKLESQAVAQNEKIMRLEKVVQEEQLTRVEAEEKLLEEQKSKRQQRKAFNREWDEFERRLLEERTLRTNIETQLAQTEAQLEEEVGRKAVLQEELEQSQRSLTQKDQDFERHKEYYEYRIRELEAARETTPTSLNNPTSPTKEEDDSEPCDWIISRNEIHVTNKTVGKGAWGQVFEGTFRGCPVAVKKIHDLILSPHNRRLFKREMSIASRCRHPCLLQFIGATNDNGSPLFITELLDTNLRAVLETRGLGDLEVFSIALDVARALNYLHLNKPFPIIHRDISSANVLLWKRDDRWRGKVSDYGAANFMRQCRTVNPGAVIYSAPEAFSAQQTPKIDVYSFGLLLCEMAIRELPVPDQTQRQIALVGNPVVKDFVVRCTKDNHEERPKMEEIVQELTPHLIRQD